MQYDFLPAHLRAHVFCLKLRFFQSAQNKAAIRVHFLFCPFPLLAAVFPHVASPPLNYEITETEQLNPIAYMVFRNNEAGLSIDACCSFFYSTFVSVAVMYYSPLLLPINFCSFYVFSHGIFIRVSFSSHISAHFYYTLCTHTHTHKYNRTHIVLLHVTRVGCIIKWLRVESDMYKIINGPFRSIFSPKKNQAQCYATKNYVISL